MNNTSFEMGYNDTDEEYIPYVYRPETYIVPFIFALIFLIGVLGNGTLVIIFSRHRTMRNVPNTYIISLALGDLLVILTCVPFTSTMYTFESWPYGLVICKISEATKDISVGVSVFTLTALSAERYCAISNPIRRHISSKPFTLVIAIAIWILAIILAVPSTLFAHIKKMIYNNQIEIKYCNTFPDEFGDAYRKGTIIYRFLIYYIFPLLIISCFYIMMAKHLEMTTRNIPGEMQGQSTQIKARKKVAKVVLSFVILFVICFLPHHIFMLWYHLHPTAFHDYNYFWHSFRIIAFCLSFLNSCINPIALYFISGSYRKYFNRYLFVCLKSDRVVKRGTISTRANSLSCRRYNSVTTHQMTLSNIENLS